MACLVAGVAGAALAWPQSPRKPAASNSEAARQHWSFRPLRSPDLPKVGGSTKPTTAVDAFILSALRKKGLALSRPLDRRKLIRRLTFDLIGLPPKPEEIEAFVKDADPRAYEKLVDRLLASPSYGERWARHWLDVARYADSDGQESDKDRLTAYHYRDFVIRALNRDMPFDQFVRWQIAGDEYEPDNPEAIAATGFIAAGTRAVLPDNLLEEERIRERYNELDDMIATTGVAFLGLTLACARCHDHKYDPVPTRDYYRVLAAFHAGERGEVPILPRTDLAKRRESLRVWQGRYDAARKEYDTWFGEQKRLLADRFPKDARVTDEQYGRLFTEEQKKRWDSLWAGLKAIETEKPPAIPTVFAISDTGPKPRDSWLLDRGDFRLKKERVELGFLSALTRKSGPAEFWMKAKAQGLRDDTTYQRRALADWMTDVERGPGALAARVIVNRIWQGHFGDGLVRTVNDFGRRSDTPSHPELLEWLASELVRNGWKLKTIHRAILLSETYRQGTAYSARGAAIDPENRLLWRRRPLRIESEIFRDSLLSAAGTLNPKMFGPSFRPPIPPEAIQARNVKDPYPGDIQESPETLRRTVYLFHKRVVQYPLMQAFDGPDAAASCGKRNVTTVAPQALAVLNEPFIRRRAEEFARRLESEAGADPSARVQRAYLLALGRPPTKKELDASALFITRRTAARAAREKGEDAGRLALTDFAQVVFGLNEFMYVD
jgi:hypothetical protein